MCILVLCDHTGFNFGDLGVERDGDEKYRIIWCVYLHATHVSTGWQSFY